ncbi:hypothetical protein GCM10010464_20360 [Pseudonocardia yunnanensis]
MSHLFALDSQDILPQILRLLVMTLLFVARTFWRGVGPRAIRAGRLTKALQGGQAGSEPAYRYGMKCFGCGAVLDALTRRITLRCVPGSCRLRG